MVVIENLADHPLQVIIRYRGATRGETLCKRQRGAEPRLAGWKKLESNATSAGRKGVASKDTRFCWFCLLIAEDRGGARGPLAGSSQAAKWR